MNRAIISEQAFLFLISSAMELYDKEAYGMLLGVRKKKDFYVKYAVPYQATYRDKYGVSISPKAETRLIHSFNFLKGCRYIGDFHSHAEGACALSKEDIVDLRDGGNILSVLLSIEQWDKYRPWKYDVKDKCLKGTIHDDYYVMIKAYWAMHGTKRYRKLRLRCDFLKTLNNRVKREYPDFWKARKANR